MNLDVTVFLKKLFTWNKGWAYVINFDKYNSIGTHLVTLSVNDENVTYFDSSRVEHTPKEIKKFVGNKNVTKNIYRIHAYDSIICIYFVLDLLILC